jgi:hypothetical protein
MKDVKDITIRDLFLALDDEIVEDFANNEAQSVLSMIADLDPAYRVVEEKPRVRMFELGDVAAPREVEFVGRREKPGVFPSWAGLGLVLVCGLFTWAMLWGLYEIANWAWELLA